MVFYCIASVLLDRKWRLSVDCRIGWLVMMARLWLYECDAVIEAGGQVQFGIHVNCMQLFYVLLVGFV